MSINDKDSNIYTRMNRENSPAYYQIGNMVDKIYPRSNILFPDEMFLTVPFSGKILTRTWRLRMKRKDLQILDNREKQLRVEIEEKNIELLYLEEERYRIRRDISLLK